MKRLTMGAYPDGKDIPKTTTGRISFWADPDQTRLSEQYHLSRLTPKILTGKRSKQNRVATHATLQIQPLRSKRSSEIQLATL